MEATNSVTAVRIQPLEDIISAVVSSLAVILLHLDIFVMSPPPPRALLFLFLIVVCFTPSVGKTT